MKESLKILREKIIKFNSAYEAGNPIVPDYIYDFYKKKLALLEQNEKIKISEYIGSYEGTQPIQHLFPVLSLDHDFGENSIEKCIKKLNKIVDPFPIIAELKIDGVSVIARYENGSIQNLKTRGNGIKGENISHLIEFIDIPDKIFIKELLEIRFEAYFDKNNIKNPRNAAAGILLKKYIDPNLAHLKFAPHNLYSKHKIWSSYSELRNLFKQMHLNLIEPSKKCYSIQDCINYFRYVENIRNSLPHEIDGIVLKIDSKEKQDQLGNTAKSPKFAYAIKFSNLFNITEIIDIQFQVGRQGKITPLAIFSEIEIKNRKISKATLNNLTDLKKKKYAVGDIVKIEMAGDVIPKVTEIIEKSNNTNYIPKICPSCHQDLIDEYCINDWNCYQQKLNRLIYFASKECINIKHLGENQIKFFVKENILNFPYDFFEIKNNINKLKNKPTWLAEKYFYKITQNIEKSRYITLENFITSIGLPNIAKTKAKEIAITFKTFENFMNAKENDLNFLGNKNASIIFRYKEKEKEWINKTFKKMKIGQIYTANSLFDSL